MRVGDAVEHQQQRIALDGIERVVERVAHRHRVDARHDALVAVRAAHLLQPLVIAVEQLRAGLLRAFDELAHALVAPRRVDVDFENRLRRGLQPDGDGMKAEQDFGSHAPMVAGGQ